MIKNLLTKLDKLINSRVASLSKKITKVITQSLKNKTKSKDISNLITVTPNNTFFDTKFSTVNTIVKEYKKLIKQDITKLTITELDLLSKELGISLDRVSFLKEINATINLQMDFLPEKIKQQIFDYVNLSMISIPEKQIIEDLTLMINKSVKQTVSLVNEVTSRLTRKHIDKLYKKSLPENQLFEYVGVNDKHITKICKDHLGLIKTRAEWNNIDPNIFYVGLHYGCRHSLVPVLEVSNV